MNERVGWIDPTVRHECPEGSLCGEMASEDPQAFSCSAGYEVRERRLGLVL